MTTSRVRSRLIWAITPGLRRIALHESAHACAALDLDLLIEHVSTALDRGDGFFSSGRVRLDGFASVYQQVIVLLAGGAAERRAYGVAELDAQDIVDARTLLAKSFRCGADDARVTQTLDELRALTDKGLDDIWPWVESVARALIRHRVLDRAAVERLRPQQGERADADAC